MIFGISAVRWLLILLASFMIGRSISKFLKREAGQNFFKALVTILIWGVILIISVFPDFAYFISEKLGMGRNLNTLIFFGFVVVFMVIFRILSIIESIERQITEIVRETAIKKELGKKK
jgi:hypothetical protein